MSFRFFSRRKLFPGVTLNLSKSGPSLSFGPRGFKHTIGPRGRRTTIGLPGTGLHYSVQHKKRGGRQRRETPPPVPPSPAPVADDFRIDPEQARAREDRDFLRIVVDFQSGRREEALAGLIALDGLVADTAWLAGIIALQEGEWAAAERHLGGALDHEADLGTLFDRNGISVEIAWPVTPEITAHIGPDPRATRLARIEALQYQSKYREALLALRDMARADPADPVVRLSLAEIAFEAEDEAASPVSMRELADFLDMPDPSDGDGDATGLAWACAFMRARALVRCGEHDNAIDGYTRAMADDDIPDDMHKLAQYERALAYGEKGEATRCRQELSTLYAHDADFADLRERLQAPRQRAAHP